MMECWRPLACAAALSVAWGIGVADAQTVVVTNASPGSTVELVVNGQTLGSTTVAPDGDASLSIDFLAKAGKTETSVRVFVDACAGVTRVLLEEGALPQAQGACSRMPITGVFLTRAVTTFVIDVSRAEPLMWLRQGPVPPEWLGETTASPRRRGRNWGSPSTGLVLSGAAGLAQFGNATSSACGNVTTCSGDSVVLGYRVGVSYWLKPFLAADVSYVRPGTVTASGSADTFNFARVLDARTLTIAGNVGVPIGPVRLYGQAGGNYHQATSTTTETITAAGTQTLTLKTAGWGWLLGGGAEFWVTRYAGIYGELAVAHLKGGAVGGGEVAIDDHAKFLFVGARLRIGR